MAGPLSNPSPRSDQPAYPGGSVVKPADGSRIREAVERKQASQEGRQPRHPSTGRFLKP